MNRMPTHLITSACSFFIAGILLNGGLSIAQGQSLTYADAVDGVGGNTTLTDGSTLSASDTTGSTTWRQRDNASFGSHGTVFEGVQPSPEIKTSVSGLTPGGQYRVYVHFWDPQSTTEDWNVRAGFSSGSLTTFSREAGAVSGSIAAALASTLTYAVAPTAFGPFSGRDMLAGFVGTTTADGSGKIEVFVDDFGSADVNLRAWYDGVSYAFIPLTVGATSFDPASPVVEGTSVTLSATVSGGTPPYSYQWQTDNGTGSTWSDIGGATDSTYVLDTTGQGGTTHQYRLQATDSAATVVAGTAATLTVFEDHTPLNLSWSTTPADHDWNTTSVNWLDAGSSTTVPFTSTDHALFDGSGDYSLPVTMSEALFPGSVTVSDASLTLAAGGAGKITGATGLTKSGAGTLTITATGNDYTGVTTISGGIVSIDTVANGGVASPIGAATSAPASLVLDSGALQYTGPTAITDRGATLGSAGGTVDVSTSGETLTVSGVMTGTGGLTKTGAGALTLSGANNYTGPTAISAGTLTVSGSGTLGSGSALSVASGGALNLNKSLTISQTVTGAGAIADNGGTVTLSGDFSGFTGTYAHNTGTASTVLTSTNATSKNASYDIAVGTTSSQGILLNVTSGDNTFELGALSGVAGSLVRNGLSVSGTSTLKIGNLNTSTTFAGVIGGGGGTVALTKVGGGTLTLSGVNTYTGGTTVSNGTLVVNGSLGGGAVNVVSGATLGGNGTLGGATTVNGTLAPSGSFPATLTVNNTLGLAGIASFRISATQNDKVQGVTTFTSGGTLNVTLESGALTGGETFTLVDATTYGGTVPAAGTLPSLDSGLNWYLGNLPVNGSITVNRAPTASALAMGVSQGDSVTLTVIDGKVPPADADGNVLSIIAVGVTSLSGSSASITGGGTSVTYTSPNDASGEDSFTYTVSDGHGGTVTETVTVTVSPAGSGANIVGGSLNVSGGVATMQALGIPGASYHLQYTGSLNPVNWQDVLDGDVQASPANGTMTLTDSDAGGPSRFYRTRYVSGP